MKLILFLLTVALFSACSNSHSTKYDAPLRQRIEKVKTTNPGEIIKFIGKCSSPVSNEMKAEIEKSGVAIGTVTGDIFTAEANVKSLEKVSALEFITQLNLSQDRGFSK